MRPDPSVTLVAVLLLGALVLAGYAAVRLRRRYRLATATQQATYAVLRTAGLAAGPLRAGLGPVSAGRAARHLRALVGTIGLAVADRSSVLAFDGEGEHHRDQLLAAVSRSIHNGRPVVLPAGELVCDRVDCAVRGGVVVPLGGTGALVALADRAAGPGLVRASLETGRWVSAQLAIAELDSSRTRLARAELRALRAQISPHFIYNALTAIGSFVRTDPERARELILEFAEFTRYSFREHGEFTTLAEEMGSIDRYLTIERARFGARLRVHLAIDPEVLPVRLPFLCLQPLVENAVRHGLSGKPGVGTVSITAYGAGTECHITVQDDGVGMAPDSAGLDLWRGRGGAGGGSTEALPDPSDGTGGDGDEPDDPGQHLGLSNVDDRLRAVFGDGYGLVVDTAPGAGTTVRLRIPKSHPAVGATRVAAGTRTWRYR